MSDPQPIEIEAAEVERLIDQAQQGLLEATDQKHIVPLLQTLVWLQRTLLETRISLAKLRKILFGKRPRSRRASPHRRPMGPRTRAAARRTPRPRQLTRKTRTERIP